MAENSSKLYDISLAEKGTVQIQLARQQMPGLMALKKQYQNIKPLKGFKVTGSMSVTKQTALLIQTLHALGARIRWTPCEKEFIDNHIAAAIVKSGTASVFGHFGQTIEQYWNFKLDALTWQNGQGPDLIIDDGTDILYFCIQGKQLQNNYNLTGEFLDFNHGLGQRQYQVYNQIIKRQVRKDPNRISKLIKNLIGIAEQTTSGVVYLKKYQKQNKLLCPCIDVNNSVTKTKFDNFYGAKHSVIDGISRALDIMISGKKVLICGFGDVGKGCAQAFRAAGARIYITQVDPICALQACMQGYQVGLIEDLLPIIDIYVTATGNKEVIVVEHMKRMKQNAIICTMGDFDQIDTDGLSKVQNIKVTSIKPHEVDKYTFEEGNSVIILGNGHCVNLCCGKGNPSLVMSNSFCNQVLALVQIVEHRHTGKYENKVYCLPKQIDQKVARLHLQHFGAKLTVLTESQSEYIGVSIKGPYKSQNYRY